MIKIEVKEAALTGRKWKDGSDVQEQVAYAFIPEANGNTPDYPQRIVMRLQTGMAPWPVGNYELLPTSLYVGDFGALTLGAPRLKEIKSQVKAVA